MTDTPILALPELESSQAIPEVVVNENTRWLEFFAAGARVLDRDEDTPPGSPSDGDAYLVATGASGVWSGHDDEIALRISTAWAFKEAVAGMILYVDDEDVGIRYDGAAWADISGSGGASTTQTTEPIGGFIASPADKDYRIAVKMPHGGTITETTTRSASGTCTATFKVNTTALGGTANSVSSSEQSQAHASTNTFVAGDDIVITVSSNASCADMSFMIQYTRTLA